MVIDVCLTEGHVQCGRVQALDRHYYTVIANWDGLAQPRAAASLLSQ